MLREKIRSPDLTEKSVQVRVLREIFIVGRPYEIGSRAMMGLSDAQALQNSTPPTVEIIV